MARQRYQQGGAVQPDVRQQQLLDEARERAAELEAQAQTADQRRQDILSLAERRATMLDSAEQRASMLDTPAGEFGSGVVYGISQSLGIPVDAVNAVLNGAGFGADEVPGGGDSIQDLMATLGVEPRDMPEPKGGVQVAGEWVGTGAVMAPAMLLPFVKAAGDPNFHENRFKDRMAIESPSPATEGPRQRARPRGGRVARVAQIFKFLGEDIAKYALEHPIQFAAGEIVGSAAAGYTLRELDEAGASTGEQLLASTVVGVVGGVTPTAVPAIGRRAYRWGMMNIFPGSKTGGRMRAAQQTQNRAEDIDAAVAKLDEFLGDMPEGGWPEDFIPEGWPEGVTPAQLLGEQRLMAQQRRMLEDNPNMDRQVRQDLEAAIARTQKELKGLFATARGQADWELAIVERIAPPGHVVVPGTTTEMVDGIYKAFAPLYAEIKGFPVRMRLIPTGSSNRRTTLAKMMDNVPNTNRVMAGDAERAKVARWLNNQMTRLRRKVTTDSSGGDYVDSADLLNMRSKIRTETRRQTRLGHSEEADLLRIAEERVNQLLHNQLPPDLLASLKQTDQWYRNFKLVDSTLERSLDRSLTPNALLGELRRTASGRGRFARSDTVTDLRSLANSGLRIDSMLDDPRKVARTVQDMNPEDLADMQSQFVESMFRRSIAPELQQAGDRVIEVTSGSLLQANLAKYDRTARALGLTSAATQRLDSIARLLSRMERASPAAVDRLFEDGPSSIAELMVTLFSVHHAASLSRKANVGMGGGFVLAQWFSNRARRILTKFTHDEAQKVMEDAVNSPTLYRALMVEPTDPAPLQDAAAQALNAWLVAQGRATVENVEEDMDMQALRQQAEELNAQ